MVPGVVRRPVVLNLSRAQRRALAGLVAVELLLVLLHGANGATADGRLLSLDQEQNLPTWFASAQLVLAATVAAIAAKGRHWMLWGTLALLLGLLSLDEVAMLHEAAETAGNARFLVRVVEPALALVVAGALVRGGRQLPHSSRLLLLAAGVALAGALGASAGGSLADGRHALIVALSVSEEGLEMLFATLALVAALPCAQARLAEDLCP